MKRRTLILLAAVPLALIATAFSLDRGGRSDDGGAARRVQQVASAPPPQSMREPAARRQLAVNEDQARVAPPRELPLGGVSAGARMLIRNGQVRLQVDSLDPSLDRVRRIATLVGGVVGNAELLSDGARLHAATLELRVPAERYEQAIEGLRRIGRLESLTQTTEDAGEEYVDTDARMSNARRLESRLLGLLATRTGRLSDVVAVERELASVRDQIERYEGRLRYLRDHAATSTIMVTVHEPATVVGSLPGRGVMADAFAQAWENFVWLVAALIQVSGIAVPLVLIALGGYFGWRRFRPGSTALPIRVRAGP